MCQTTKKKTGWLRKKKNKNKVPCYSQFGCVYAFMFYLFQVKQSQIKSNTNKYIQLMTLGRAQTRARIELLTKKTKKNSFFLGSIFF